MQATQDWRTRREATGHRGSAMGWVQGDLARSTAMQASASTMVFAILAIRFQAEESGRAKSVAMAVEP